MISILQNYKNDNHLYFSYLKAVCSLSKLFSESKVPYLYYRVAENVFCKAFGAENLSRDDLAYDARKGNVGIGLKTFIDKGTNHEKVAEFNAFSKQLRNVQGKNLAIKLSELRNERIAFANRTYGIDKGIYHCVARSEKALKIFETTYDVIDIENIRNIKSKDASISFEDEKNNYSFNFSKTTLFKKFVAPQDAIIIDVDILEDPLELILQLFKQQHLVATKFEVPGVDFVILPLYSLRESKAGGKNVSQKSGLNQWNAGGRKRDVGEVYIPIPIQIHKNFPDFFPDRETPFNLQVPTSEILNAKVCQENGKALMTNPNKALSDWLLRKVLKLEEGEILTYEKLKVLGIDSVRITKIDNENFKIDFAKLNRYDNFINKENNE
ncbi:MAG: restriction endonuclease [Bacteroidetes bacterium]|nr:restriction endonuclease [Bacteroidota bacterium]